MGNATGICDDSTVLARQSPALRRLFSDKPPVQQFPPDAGKASVSAPGAGPARKKPDTEKRRNPQTGKTGSGISGDDTESNDRRRKVETNVERGSYWS